MNKIVIIAALCGLGVGGAGGYLACHFIEKKNVDKEISDGVQQVVKEKKLWKMKTKRAR